MYSLNVPVPGELKRLASDLHPDLFEFDSVRERHTLVVKRLDDGDYHRLESRVRNALVGAPAVEAHVSGIDYFERPARGDGPVVYLAVESPGLREIHERLCSAFDPVEGLEGDDYVPHVTLARGGNVTTARRLAERDVDSVTWTIDRLVVWDATYEESAAEIRLPA